MSGKENIIANILQNAEAEKAEILRNAQEKIAQTERADEAYCAALRSETLEKTKKERTVTVERYISVANMDVKKLLLKAKRDQISVVLQRAEEYILALDADKYNAFLVNLLDKNAESGDKAVFSVKDKDRAARAIEYAQEKGYDPRSDGDFSGGLILEGKNFDKNLTVSMLLKEYQESHEGEIAAILGD